MSDKPALVQNAADPGQVKAAEEKLQFGREQELNDVAWVLSAPEGRRFFERYLGLCGVFRSSFGNGNDTTNFNEGERNIGLKLLNDLNEANPQAYVDMLQEKLDRQLKQKKRNRSKRNEDSDQPTASE